MQQILRAPAPRPIFDGLRGIAPESDPESLPPGAPVRKTLDIDSYDFLMSLIDLNGALGIDGPESDCGKLRSLNEMGSYLSVRTVAPKKNESDHHT